MKKDKYSDGCTGVPEFNFKGCCIEHDGCYACCYSWKDKIKCDLKFKKCITSKGHPIIAWIYFLGISIFGWYYFYKKGFRSET